VKTLKSERLLDKVGAIYVPRLSVCLPTMKAEIPNALLSVAYRFSLPKSRSQLYRSCSEPALFSDESQLSAPPSGGEDLPSAHDTRLQQLRPFLPATRVSNKSGIWFSLKDDSSGMKTLDSRTVCLTLRVHSLPKTTRCAA
jgi:hypothetical protein